MRASDGTSLLTLGNWSRGLIVASLSMILCLISAVVLCNGDGASDVPTSGVGCTSVVLLEYGM